MECGRVEEVWEGGGSVSGCVEGSVKGNVEEVNKTA